MKFRTSLILLPLSLALFLLIFGAQLLRPAAAEQPITHKLDPALLVAFDSAETARYIVHLKAAASFDGIPQRLPQAAQRGLMIEQLQSTAAASQPPVQQTVEQAGASATSLWIINALVVEGSAELAQSLAARSDVAYVALDVEIEAPTAPVTGSLLSADYSDYGTPWGVEHTRAAHVWNTLGFRGAGVTVAIVDTGIDYTHPSLIENYRGNLGDGTFDHSASWFDATITPTLSPEPIDPVWHGTHVAGIAIGRDGVGVAPDAEWMAARVFNRNGLGHSSWMIQAFQWLLAPNGDPTLAPDVINNSWGFSGYFTGFVETINVLHTAGIMTVFSAGNQGALAGTIGAPASYPDTLAVGASDHRNQVAWFSSGGPSELTDEIKPQVVAPGVWINSTFPNGLYAAAFGTSMAAPHVSGIAALLLEADPTLSYAEVKQLITETARPIESLTGHPPTVPNYRSGWGVVDAWAALSKLTNATTTTIQLISDGEPLPYQEFSISRNGALMPLETDAAGNTQLWLNSADYWLYIDAYGYEVKQIRFDPAQLDNNTLTVELTKKTAATIRGTIQNADGFPIAATVQVANTPISVTASADGTFELQAPDNGLLQLVISKAGWRLHRQAVFVLAPRAYEVDITLEPGPSVLLVDSEGWQYRLESNYHRQALSALNYSYDELTVWTPLSIPIKLHQLEPYDTIIWAAPTFAPGQIGMGQVISQYLGTGGNLLISGQNLGRQDGSLFGAFWWFFQLGGQFEEVRSPTHTVAGAPGSVFEGATVSFNAGDSARNQQSVEQADPRDGTSAETILQFSDGASAGLGARHCRPFNIVYFGFGLEGVDTLDMRTDLVQRSFDYFNQPLVESDIAIAHQPIDDFTIAAEQNTYTVTLVNRSETTTETISLALDSTWSAELITPTVTLGPCESAHVAFSITAPDSVGQQETHSAQLSAVSAPTGATAELSITHTTPGKLLFVDDDRWYNNESVYRDYFAARGIDVDYWEVGWNSGFAADARGPIPESLLHTYDIVFWYTGADWFEPITDDEAAMLERYLANGGRLFYAGQDYMFHHPDDALTQTYFGIGDYTESLTMTTVYGQASDHPASLPSGPWSIAFDTYNQFGDGLLPTSAEPIAWHNGGMVGAVAHSGVTTDAWRTVFWGLPLELMEPAGVDAALNSAVGYLSDLGPSMITVDDHRPSLSQTLRFTINVETIENAGATSFVEVTNTLPAGLSLVDGSVSGAAWNAADARLTWSGWLTGSMQHLITYETTVDAAAPPALLNTVSFSYDNHNISFERSAELRIDQPNLTPSYLFASGPLTSGDNLTLTLHLHNIGAGGHITTHVYVPHHLNLLTPTVQASADSITIISNPILSDTIVWNGLMPTNSHITVTWAMTSGHSAYSTHLPTIAAIDSGHAQPLLRQLIVARRPTIQHYISIIAK